MKRLIAMAGLALAMTLLWSPREAAAQFCHRARVVVHAPAAHHAVKAVVVEKVIKAVPVVVSPDYYYSVSDSYRDALLADAIAFRVLAAQQRATQPLPRYGTTPATPATPAAPAAPPATPPAGTPTAVPEALQKLVDARCVKCHGGPGQNGIDLTNLAAVPEGARWKSYALVNAGEMPKGGAAISDDEVKLFFAWAKSARAK